ncbi:MAG: transketolase [Desulfobulbaceae bacterium A2]|nr:MAG: transketolase [Desulfobulbaceae bacterium A2]
MTLHFDTSSASLTTGEVDSLRAMRRRCARRILLSTTLAASGHPGGSLSSLDLLLVLYGMIRHDPSRPGWEERDRVVVSMGHITPGVYSVLTEYGYVTEEDFLTGFRRTGSGFPGHVERIVPGVEWDTGNLGQGLSAAVGMAVAAKARGRNTRVVVLMGDGEHQKGQIVEAIRSARKFGLDNLTVVVDRNHLQICGDTQQIMPQSIRALYHALGWQVDYLQDGHDQQSIFQALRRSLANRSGLPTVIVARTVMGKGISFMEHQAKYHGSPLKPEQLAQALTELGLQNDEAVWRARRSEPLAVQTHATVVPALPRIDPGTPLLYPADAKSDNRSAYGKALLGLSQANNQNGAPRVVGVSCDLEGSVKMDGLHKHCPAAFFEIGIQEHHAAVMAGAMSREGLVTFFSTFGVFAVSEVYNQNRLNDFNETNLKVVATHLGLDVGEDGPTHQCIDYLGLLKHLFRFSVFMPADPNQTDRIVRYVATRSGNHFVGMGRSLVPVVTDEAGQPFFGTDYVFTPGKADWLRRGEQATIVTYGALVPAAMAAWQELRNQGLSVGLLNMASLVPLDQEALLEAARIGPVLVAEDHHRDTGLGASAAALYADHGLAVRLRRQGVSRYGASGKPAELYRQQGLDSASLAAAIRDMLV